nr:right-handed parallel beta-helix repeat-containing protein [Lachnospiraceae bacterium]
NPAYQTAIQQNIFLSGSNGTSEKYFVEKKLPQMVGWSATEKEKQFYKKYFRAMVTEFFDLAAADTSGLVQYRIMFAPGTYKMYFPFKIPNNVCFYAVGSTFVPDTSNSTGKKMENMFFNATVGSGANIQMIGGTWDVTGQSYASGSKVQTASVAKFCGITGLEMTGVTIKSNRWSHIMEIADTQLAVFSGCTFTGNNKDSDDNSYLNVQPKEALQLDVATVSAMGSIAKGHANGKGCSYVTITGCKFTNCGRGVGAHVGKKTQFSEISIINNTFKNSIGEAIFIQGLKDSTVANNKISKARRAGMFIYYCKNINVTGNTVKSVSSYTGNRGATFDTDHYSAQVWNSKNIYIKGNKFKAKQGGKTVRVAESKGVTAQK